MIMRAITYALTGDPDVLGLDEVELPEPADHEVRVRIEYSGVNPTDWKSRRGAAPGPPLAFDKVVPNQDGAGVVDAVGAGVSAERIGERVWVWEAAYQRRWGTAAEYTVVPESRAVPLPPGVSTELGAALPIPFMTAHRCLTLNELGPQRLSPGALAGRTVLVAGGAGAVGNAAIQLARWAGAEVISTVSGPEKAALATAAGAQHVLNYREIDVVAAVREIAPDGVDVIVEVAPAQNAALDAAVIALHGVVAIYANNGGDEMTLPVRQLMAPNARWQFVLVYTEPEAAKRAAIESITVALTAGAIRVGADAGLPLHHFDLARTAVAHAAVEAGVTGKVLITVDPPVR
jgi:NADPH2:quinone reductase